MMGSRNRATLLALIALLAFGPASWAVIKVLTPLRSLLADGQFVIVARVEKLLPDRPAMVLAVADDLKGKAPFRSLPVNLTGDREGKKTNDTARLLKRLAKDMPVVLFVNQRGQRFTAFAYSSGTWFQMIGQKVDERVVWSFTHLEPYLRRTYKGDTVVLARIVRDALAGKIKPPEADAKEAPGIGPEIAPSKAKTPSPSAGDKGGQSHAATGALFAVIPTLGIGGPLAILALLFPSLFGGVLVLFRQWASFLMLISAVSLLYLFHWLFGGSFREAWWTSPGGMSTIVIAATFLCGIWSWRRNWSALAKGQPSIAPQKTENIVLIVLSLTCLAIVLLYMDARLDALDWSLLLGFSAGIWAALAYKLFRWLSRSAAGIPLPSEGIILWTLLFTMAGLAMGRKGQAVEQVEVGASTSAARWVGKLWEFQAPGSGCIVSAPFVTDDRVYVASAHPTFRYGALFCLDRATGRGAGPDRKFIWEFIDEGNLKQVFSSPTVSYGKLFIGEGFHDDANCKVYCIDADTGRKLWDYQTTSQTESTPAVRSNRVYIGAGNDGLLALHVATGKKLWQYPPDPGQGRLLRFGAGPVAVPGGKLYVGTGVDRNRQDDPGETALLCLESATGKLVWKTPVDLPSWGAPVVKGDDVFFGIGNGDIFDDAPKPAGAMLCLDAASGKIRWRTDFPNGILDRPAVDKERVYFGCRDGHCYGLDRASGQIRWKNDLGSPVIAAPALAPNSMTGRTASVYALGSRGKVRCLDPVSGTDQWTFSLDDKGRQFAHLSAAPTVVVSRTREGDRRHLYFAAALDSPTSGRAMLYCLEDLLPVNGE